MLRKIRTIYVDKFSHYIDVAYNKYYPFTVWNRLRTKHRNQKANISIICGNCMGGYMYHQLGLRFGSPTINLVIPEFYKFVFNIDFYLKQRFTEADESKISKGVPIGKLYDIKVIFTHYYSYENACYNWYKRIGRINYDALYIIDSDISLTDEMMKEYGNLKCKKLIIFTSKKYDYPYCFLIKKFIGLPHVGSILGKTIYGKWQFEKWFDWVGWINSEDPVAEHFRIK
jgi:uncharacterized protein (DUF1919 family)